MGGHGMGTCGVQLMPHHHTPLSTRWQYVHVPNQIIHYMCTLIISVYIIKHATTHVRNVQLVIGIEKCKCIYS